MRAAATATLQDSSSPGRAVGGGGRQLPRDPTAKRLTSTDTSLHALFRDCSQRTASELTEHQPSQFRRDADARDQ